MRQIFYYASVALGLAGLNFLVMVVYIFFTTKPQDANGQGVMIIYGLIALIFLSSIAFALIASATQVPPRRQED